jgi:hypothetical protein
MTLVGFIPGPSCTLATSSDDRPARFCFHCRKHLPHSWALMDDPPERQPSYYEAVPVLRCSRCGDDHASFPGLYIDGPRYPSESVWADLVEQAQKTRDSWDWDAIWRRMEAERVT